MTTSFVLLYVCMLCIICMYWIWFSVAVSQPETFVNRSLFQTQSSFINDKIDNESSPESWSL